MATVGPVRSRRSYCWEAAHQTLHQTAHQTVHQTREVHQKRTPDSTYQSNVLKVSRGVEQKAKQ